MKAIWFDMDGTIADLYGVDGWLADLIAESTRPYEIAKPLVNMNSLARILNRLARSGWEINIVSWTSKNSSAEYNAKVALAKKIWLESHLRSVNFTKIDIISYGTPKNENRKGILFDDEIGNRSAWDGTAYDADKIIETLKALG